MQHRNIISFLIFLILIPLGAFGGVLLDFAIADLIYPDPCIYHFRPEPKNIFFTVFFDYNSATGYHPEPSTFSMIFYALTGVIIGLLIAKLINKFLDRNLRRNASNMGLPKAWLH